MHSTSSMPRALSHAVASFQSDTPLREVSVGWATAAFATVPIAGAGLAFLRGLTHRCAVDRNFHHSHRMPIGEGAALTLEQLWRTAEPTSKGSVIGAEIRRCGSG